MKKIVGMIIFYLLINSLLYGQETASNDILKTRQQSVVVKEVTGQGGSRDSAIRDGLYRAVEQVRGIKVDSGSYKFVYGGAGVGIGTVQPEERRVEFDSVGVAARGTAYTTEIEGLVKTYDILEFCSR
jgi:hypothetical protein